MSRNKGRQRKTLTEIYPPSAACSCAVCVSFCRRPGWWTVEQAARAIEAGLAGRMMLEIAPEGTFAVVAPAFRGCEGSFALQGFANRGCTFFTDGGCELHGTDLQPLECRFCHHERLGLGMKCHAAIEGDWNTAEGRALAVRWGWLTGVWERIKRLQEGRFRS
jgi:hypothetical protein